MKGVATPPRPRTGPPDNRERILIATSRAIARRGVRGLRVEDVASEAGVSAALLYYHFDSRSGLVKAALEHASEQAPSTALGRASTTKSGYEAVEAALLAELGDDPIVRDNAVVWGEVTMSAVFEPELREDVRRVTQRWQASVADGIRNGIADGSIRADIDPDEVSELLISLVDGLCNRWLAGAMERERARLLLRQALRRSLQTAAPRARI